MPGNPRLAFPVQRRVGAVEMVFPMPAGHFPGWVIIDDRLPPVLNRAPWMADVAQLVERQVVVLDVVGSKPIVRPSFPS